MRARHVKQLESRSLLLDTALASADEANRRWEECRGVLDGLRAENAQLRADNARLRAENASLHGALSRGSLETMLKDLRDAELAPPAVAEPAAAAEPAT
jgi:cell division protein FtsB